MALSNYFPAFLNYVPNQYLRAVAVLIFLFLIFRMFLSVFEKIFFKFAAKTKTEIDDLLLKKSAKPLSFVALVLSLRFAIGEIALSPAVELNLARFVYSLLVIAIGYVVFVFVDIALVAAWEKVAKRSHIPVNQSLTSVFQRTLRVILIALAFIYVLDVWGVEIVPVLGALGVAGLAVALALQPVLSNIFSGISLIIDKSVRIGDWVIIDDKTSGTIEHIGIRSTRVRTFDNDMIIIPNTKLADSYIRNASLPEPKVRKVVSFSFAHGQDVDKVKRIVLSEIKKIKYVVDEPEPSVQFVEIAQNGLNFKAFFYIDSFENGYAAIDEANTRIYKSLETFSNGSK